MPFGGQSVSCQSLSPYRNPLKFYHTKTRDTSLSSVLFLNPDGQLYKISLLDKKNYLFVDG